MQERKPLFLNSKEAKSFSMFFKKHLKLSIAVEQYLQKYRKKQDHYTYFLLLGKFKHMRKFAPDQVMYEKKFLSYEVSNGKKVTV